MLFYAVAGRVVDHFGTRVGYAISLVWWSIAAAAHAIARSVFGLGIARIGLAIGEAGCWPASAKAIAEWFPKKERPLASGIFDSGSKAGMVLSPVFIAFLITAVGWRFAFIINGLIGILIVLPLWLLFYQQPAKHKLLSQTERDYINENTDRNTSEQGDTVIVKPNWRHYLMFPQTYGLMLIYGSTSLSWMVMQNYLPLYFVEARGQQLNISGLATSATLIGAVFGNILGGVIIGMLIRKCQSIRQARFWSVLISSVLIAAMLFAAMVKPFWLSIFLMAVSAFGFSMASTNAISMPSDFVPRNSVATYWGLVATGSMLWMLPLKTYIGAIAQHYGWFTALAIPALLPLVGVLAMMILIRKYNSQMVSYE
jgi:ACS family hexuronate transporter-like MFS transporter